MAWNPTHWFAPVVARAFSNTGLDLTGGDIKAALLESTYTPDQDAHDFFSDVSADELSDASYDPVALTNKTLTYDAPTNKWIWSADPVVFPTLTTAGFRFVVFYLDSGDPATSPLIAYAEHDSDIVGSGSDVTLNVPADGIVFASVL